MTKQTEPETPATPEVDYKAKIAAWLDKNLTTDEHRSTVKAVSVSERLGRQVAVTLEVPGNTDTIQVPRQDLIQVLFERDWHRTQILKIFPEPITYQIIFAATKGMENKHHKEGTTASNGAGRASKTYKVDMGAGEVEATRKEYFKYLVEAKKMSRGDIVKHMKEQFGEDIAYPTVFQATKDLDVPKAPKAPKAEKTEKAATTKAAKNPDTKATTDKSAAKAAKAAAKAKNTEPVAADPAEDAEDFGRDDKLSL